MATLAELRDKLRLLGLRRAAVVSPLDAEIERVEKQIREIETGHYLENKYPNLRIDDKLLITEGFIADKRQLGFFMSELRDIQRNRGVFYLKSVNPRLEQGVVLSPNGWQTATTMEIIAGMRDEYVRVFGE